MTKQLPNFHYDLTNQDGRLGHQWAAAYMMQQVGLAVMQMVEELRKIRNDMPLNDKAQQLRAATEAEDAAALESIEKAKRAWMHSSGLVSWPLRISMARAAEDGQDVTREDVCRTLVAACPLTEKGQANMRKWWAKKYPSTMPPAVPTKIMPPRNKAEGGAK